MNTFARIQAGLLIALCVATPSRAFATDEPEGHVEIEGGTVAFDADTNIPAITIHGESSSLTGNARIRSVASGLVLERLRASLPVASIRTGIGLRDDHMRKHVFTTEDGHMPDLQFFADAAHCTGSDTRSTCLVSGELTIRGTTRPLAMELALTRDGTTLRAAGGGVVKLSSYGIPQPTQLGVKTTDDVEVHVDFVVRPVPGLVAAAAARDVR